MTRQKVIDLNKQEAKDFFLESESYCSIDLPEYFNFKGFLKEVSEFGSGFVPYIRNARKDVTSHIIYNNKDGKYAWRKLELVHPVIYLKLVDVITDNWEFIQNHFRVNKVENIHYGSIYKKQNKHKKQKQTQILSYLEEIEKESIKKSLEYKYLSKLDITDCYPSVYTHSVPWALHTKAKAKNNRGDSFKNKNKKKYLVGNDIDFLLRAMQNGQTNGIPQGSILMDFIAEIILTRIDKLLWRKLICQKITEYRIIRYRDDYRIFTNEKVTNEKIIKTLSEILMRFNFKLNANKTEVGEDIILMSIKKDKLDNITYHIGSEKDVDVYKLKRLLLDILNISKTYPNSGFILKILQRFNQKRFYQKSKNWYKNEIELLITILLDIVINNPRCFAVVCVSIFNLLPKLENDKQKYFSDIIYKKLSGMNNVGYNEIWLQRCLYKVDKTKTYKDKMCKVVDLKKKESIFNNRFISDNKLKSLLSKNNFVDRKKLSKISKIPKETEVNIFDDYNYI